MSSKVRCVGGSQDGNFIDYPGHQKYMVASIPDSFRAAWGRDAYMNGRPEVQQETYNLETYYLHGIPYRVLVHESLNIKEAILILKEGGFINPNIKFVDG